MNVFELPDQQPLQFSPSPHLTARETSTHPFSVLQKLSKGSLWHCYLACTSKTALSIIILVNADWSLDLYFFDQSLKILTFLAHSELFLDGVI